MSCLYSFLSFFLSLYSLCFVVFTSPLLLLLFLLTIVKWLGVFVRHQRLPRYSKVIEIPFNNYASLLVEKQICLRFLYRIVRLRADVKLPTSSFPFHTSPPICLCVVLWDIETSYTYTRRIRRRCQNLIVVISRSLAYCVVDMNLIVTSSRIVCPGHDQTPFFMLPAVSRRWSITSFSYLLFITSLSARPPPDQLCGM